MKKAFSIVFALLTLWVSMHMGIASHFCRGELAQSALVLGTSDVGCGMECNIPHSPASHTTVQEQSCCSDEFIAVEADDYSFATNHVSPFPIVLRTLFAFDINNSNNFSVADTYFNHLPPTFTKVTLPFIQVFII